MLLIVLNCKTRERYENKQKAGMARAYENKNFSLQVVEQEKLLFYGFIDAGVNIEMLIAAGEPKYNI